MNKCKYWEYVAEAWSISGLINSFINFLPETKVHEQCASVLGYDRYWMYHLDMDYVY